MAFTPPPMAISAAFERWQPGIASPRRRVVVVGGRAERVDVVDELLLVLPAQRPASPEMAESPTLTTHGVPTPGPSAIAGAARPHAATTVASAQMSLCI